MRCNLVLPAVNIKYFTNCSSLFSPVKNSHICPQTVGQQLCNLSRLSNYCLLLSVDVGSLLTIQWVLSQPVLLTSPHLNQKQSSSPSMAETWSSQSSRMVCKTTKTCNRRRCENFLSIFLTVNLLMLLCCYSYRSSCYPRPSYSYTHIYSVKSFRRSI